MEIAQIAGFSGAAFLGRSKKFAIILMACLAFAAGFSRAAVSQTASAEDRIKALEDRIKLLEDAMQKAGIQMPPREIEALPAQDTAAQTKSYTTPAEKRRAGRKTRIGKSIEFDGLLESEMRFNRESGGNGRSATSSDILLSTAQLGWRTTIGDGAAGNLVLLWEQDQPDPLHIDEGSITWVEDNYDFTAGFFFPPFGTFNSRFIVHPITQDLGETQQGAVKFHYAASKTFDSSITIADGKARKERTRSDKANDYCLRLDATPDIGKNKSASIGIQYYSNFANTNADLLGIASATDTFVLRRMAGGAGINLELAGGPFGLTGEYIGATKRFDPANLDANGDGGGDRPKAWNLELYYNRSVKNVLSFKYEGSGEFAGSPKSRYGINSNWNAGEGLTFSFEFLTASYSAGFAPAKAYGNTRRSNSVYSKFSLEF